MMRRYVLLLLARQAVASAKAGALAPAGRGLPDLPTLAGVAEAVQPPDYCKASVPARNAFGVHRNALKFISALRRYAIR
jgi:hypothetical protein